MNFNQNPSRIFGDGI